MPAGFYRLPTEAQWEKAAGWDPDQQRHYRFGEHSDGCGYNCLDGQRANYLSSGDPYDSGPSPETAPAGFYNGALHSKDDFNWPSSVTSYQTQDAQSYYGAYDMCGNVSEWCYDWYSATYYESSPDTDPTGPTSGTWRVLRGGGWLTGLHYGRSAYRGLATPPYRREHIGFRTVRPADCNGNGIPDQYDVAPGGGSTDVNNNGVPDECEDCNGNLLPDDIDLQICQGQPWCSDCNENGVLDVCDIEACEGDATCGDCNGDGIPDGCQYDPSDCNGNGLSDQCEVEQGLADDCNGNYIPDACDIDPTDPDENGLVSEDCNINTVPDECDIDRATRTRTAWSG